MSDSTNEATELFTSPIITVLAGPDKRAVSVHAAVLEVSSSPVIRALVSEDWKEGQDRLVDWSHTDVPTVLRVISYFYTGDYEVEVLDYVGPGKQLQKWANGYNMAFHRIHLDAPGQASVVTTNPSTATNSAVIPRPLTPLATIMANNVIIDSRPASYASLLLGSQQSLDPNIIAGYLQAHAKVYVFAQSHLISDLESFSLGRMGRVLQFAQTQAQPQAALSAIKVVYENTVKPKAKQEPMRRLLSQFVVIHHSRVRTLAEFTDLIEEGGDFALDITEKMSRKMEYGGA